MSQSVRTPMPRCCPVHRDWPSLARHLLADFSDVPTRAIIDEMARAKSASELFELEHADALDCVELIVRHRVLSATGRAPMASPVVVGALAEAITRVA